MIAGEPRSRTSSGVVEEVRPRRRRGLAADREGENTVRRGRILSQPRAIHN